MRTSPFEPEMSSTYRPAYAADTGGNLWLPGVRSSSALNDLDSHSPHPSGELPPRLPTYAETLQALTIGLQGIAEESAPTIIPERQPPVAPIALSLSAPDLSALTALAEGQLPPVVNTDEYALSREAQPALPLHAAQGGKATHRTTAAEKLAAQAVKDQFFKTKLCIPFVSGHCRRGKNCW